jgi:hypothetical protein
MLPALHRRASLLLCQVQRQRKPFAGISDRVQLLLDACEGCRELRAVRHGVYCWPRVDMASLTCQPGILLQQRGRAPSQMVYIRHLPRFISSAACLPHAFLPVRRQSDSSPLCTSTRQQHRSVRRRRCQPTVASSAAASAWATPAGFQKPDTSADDEQGTVPAPAALPPTPKSSSLLDVFPYLAKLALSERSLYWRLALALMLMIASKVAGWCPAATPPSAGTVCP